MLNMSSEAVVITEQGTATETHVRRTPGEFPSQTDGKRNECRACEHSVVPDGTNNKLNVQVSVWRDPLSFSLAPWMRCQWRRKWRGHTFADQTSSDGLSAKGVLNAETYELGVADSQLTVKSEGCRKRIVELLLGPASGAARLVAADERTNRALAEALEPHASRDPGSREVLKSTSAVPS